MVIVPLWFRWLLWRPCPLQGFVVGFARVGIVLAQVVVVPGFGCFVVVVVAVGLVDQFGCPCLARLLVRLDFVWCRVFLVLAVLVEFPVELLTGWSGLVLPAVVGVRVLWMFALVLVVLLVV